MGGSEDPRIIEPWYNSSANDGSSCVDTQMLSDGSVQVRHSRHHDTVITYTREEWDAFVDGVLAGKHRAYSRI